METRLYYLFNQAAAELIEATFPEKSGNGFFNFTEHNKNVRLSNIPRSNTSEDLLYLTRPMLVLEVQNWDEADFPIKAAAESQSEYWIEAINGDVGAFHWFKTQVDSVTIGKTKEELDLLYASEMI